MKYAVIYQSDSGNTRKIAETIYDTIRSEDKIIMDIAREPEMPWADFYFIGFGIHNGNCPIEMLEYLEEIRDAKYALFMTCGFLPSAKYKDKIMDNLDIWLPEDAELADVFLCQGRVEERQKDRMLRKMPENSRELEYMFEQAQSHPNGDDLQAATDFAERVWKMAEQDIR